MSTIVTRAGKGSPLTNNEVDANFVNLNTDKIESITSVDGSVVITPTGTTRDLSVGTALNTATLISQVRNETGATLTKGTVVYISGAGGNKALVSKALANADSTSAQTYGVIQADISNNQNGYVVVVGSVSGLNTIAYPDGTQLYLSGTTAGTYTSTKPYAPIHLVYVGIVTYSHATQGTIQVKIQNGYEMDELHNVAAQSPSNGQTLVYNTSTSLWEKNTVSLTAGVNGVLPTANGGTNLSSFTSGGVVYASSSSALATGSVFTFNGSVAEITTASTGGIIGFTAGNSVALGYSALTLKNTGASGKTYEVGMGGNGTSGNYQNNFYIRDTTGNPLLYLNSTNTFVANAFQNVRAAGIDTYINHVTTGINNTVMGFNNSGSTNANGVPNNTAYYGSLNTYSTAITGNGAVIATFVSSAVGAQGISVNGVVNITQTGYFPTTGFTHNTNGYLYALGGTNGFITQVSAVNVTTTTASGFAVTGTFSASGAITNTAGTANGVAYLNGSKVLTSGSALTYDGTKLNVIGSAPNQVNFSVTATGSDLFRVQPQASGTGVYLQTTDYAQTVYAPMGFYATTFTFNADATIYGVTVGRGAGAVSTNTVVGASAFTTNSTGANNVAVGRFAGLTNNGSANTFIGDSSGYWNSTGSNNVGVGFASYAANTTAATGSNNTAVGRESLYNNTTASNNTAVGYQAGYLNQTGTRNTQLGAQAGYTNNGGNYNVYLGSYAGDSGSGSSNVAVGDASLRNTGSGTSGSSNVAVGQAALGSLSSGNNNVAVGFESLNINTSASNNTAVGYRALSTSATYGYQTAVGYRALATVNAGYNNTAMGASALAATTAGVSNVGIGDSALTANLAGSQNVAIGQSALITNSSGSNNTAIGSNALNTNNSNNNTAVGYQSLYSSTGTGVVALGYKAGFTISSATATIAIGSGAMGNSVGVAGSYNTAIGDSSLNVVTSGNRNIGIGNEALVALTSGICNVAIGSYNEAGGNAVMASNTSGSYNVAIGNSALNRNLAASFNVAVGNMAGEKNVDGQGLVFIGTFAGQNNTSGNNTAIGYAALTTNTTGGGNVAVGGGSPGTTNGALGNNTSGGSNTAVGFQALISNQAQNNLVAMGYQAGYLSSGAGNSVFVGAYAGYTGNGEYGYNTLVGHKAGYNLSNTTGAYGNTFIGCSSQTGNGAGYDVTTGTQNTIIGGFSGNQGGLNISALSNFIVLSDGAGNPRGVFDGSGNYMVYATVKETRGVTIYGTGANGTYIKTTGTTNYWITNDGAGTGSGIIATIYNDTSIAGTISVLSNTTSYTSISDYRLKENVQPMTGALAKVSQLKPVTYTWKVDGASGQGFIAHELQAIVPDCVVGVKDALDENGNISPQSVDTSFLVATLTAAIQEQQAIIESLKARLDAANL